MPHWKIHSSCFYIWSLLNCYNCLLIRLFSLVRRLRPLPLLLTLMLLPHRLRLHWLGHSSLLPLLNFNSVEQCVISAWRQASALPLLTDILGIGIRALASSRMLPRCNNCSHRLLHCMTSLRLISSRISGYTSVFLLIPLAGFSIEYLMRYIGRSL